MGHNQNLRHEAADDRTHYLGDFSPDAQSIETNQIAEADSSVENSQPPLSLLSRVPYIGYLFISGGCADMLEASNRIRRRPIIS